MKSMEVTGRYRVTLASRDVLMFLTSTPGLRRK